MGESVGTQSDKSEELLERYFAEPDREAAESLLLRLVFEHWQPVIRKVVNFKLAGSAATAQDAEDVCSDALVDILARTGELRGASANPIEKPDAYVATIAYRACHDYFRRRFPQRHRLKNRLRYLMRPGSGFAIWPADSGELLCGLEGWQSRAAGRLPAEAPDAPADASMAPLVRAILAKAAGPVEFDGLVSLVAVRCGVRDEVVPLEQAPDSAQASPQNIENWERYIPILWAEIGALPVNQRVALLLNLRGAGSLSPVALFPLTGAASIPEIARALEIPLEEFAALWGRLPIGDTEIAGRLGVTRQQVINLRVSARRRLERRMPEATQDLFPRQ